MDLSNLDNKPLFSNIFDKNLIKLYIKTVQHLFKKFKQYFKIF